jgi:hypothetical protein
MVKYSHRFFGFFIFLVSFLLSETKAETFFPATTHQDTSLMSKIIRLSSNHNTQISTVCAHKITETLCELNELYLDQNITFSIHESETGFFPVDSVLSIHVDNNQCRVYYDKDYIDKIGWDKLNPVKGQKPVKAYSGQLQVIKPAENTTVYYKDIIFSLPENPEIDHYQLDVATDAQFMRIVKSLFVFGNQTKIDQLSKNEMFYWRIKPLHPTQYCQEYRAEGKFFTVDIHVKTMSLFGISLYTIGPTTFFVNNPEHKWYTIEIESLEGALISKIESNASHKLFDANEYQPGHYFVKLRYQKFENTTILTVR